MKLEDFVAETIRQVVRGVKDAQEQVRADGGIVNPSYIPFHGPPEKKSREIEFDIALTASEGTTTKGGMGVLVGPVALGSRGQSERNTANVSRIRFSVPIELPFLNADHEESERAARLARERGGKQGKQ